MKRPPVRGKFEIYTRWRRSRLYPPGWPFGTVEWSFTKETTWDEVHALTEKVTASPLCLECVVAWE